jgi:hypothetical protein
MAIDVFQLWEKWIGNVNTHQGGHVKPERNFLNWCNDISFSLFETKFASSWEKSQKVDDDLAKPFLKTKNIEVKNGIAKYPEDYAHFSAARVSFRKSDGAIGFRPGVPFIDCNGNELPEKSCPKFISEEVYEIIQSQQSAEKPKDIEEAEADEFGEKNIDKVDSGRWGAIMDHRFSRPTLNNPAITQGEGGWKVAPAGVKNIIVDYLRKPMLATFNYKVVPGDIVTGQGDNIQYDPNGSKPLEWDELIVNEFLNLLEKKYGKFIREEFIWQTSESDRTKTF